MWQTVSNHDLPPADQLPFWRELIADALAPLSLNESTGAVGFPASASVLDLGSVRVGGFTSPPVDLDRTWADIRRSDPGTYQLAFVTGSELWVSQRRQDSGFVGGDMVLFDLSYPFEGGVPDRGPADVVILQIPRAEMPLHPDKVHRLLAQPLSANTGMGAILAQFLRSLHSHGPDCDQRDLASLGTIALDLAGACLAQHLGCYADLPAESRQQALLARVNAFIDHNIGDPDLKPATIAAHHHISLRSLHALHRQQGETVSASIRRRRLEGCHTDLTDPRLRQRSIGAIAARWGFRNLPDFSRAFRAAYGRTPSEARRAVGRDG
ncbi:hypothetical protein BLA60_35380 [Actinophytocola xinjiangensis]|uniref:HTH araC/xylS-type domain-containing protein n=1 Tax=Actinophytocola xinjiangensis TaxID=485602 RepID=A0A7Z1AVD9_9PSEU|nr:hypothetical protein BLA60_35380 [Actinophytocola xinjiangensis]